MRVGKCKLCQRIGELQDSHFMSKGIFAQLRTPTAKNPHPVLMTPQVSVTSVETLFAAVAGFSILVKSNVAANRPAESTLAGLIEASFSVTRISASAAYSCSDME